MDAIDLRYKEAILSHRIEFYKQKLVDWTNTYNVSMKMKGDFVLVDDILAAASYHQQAQNAKTRITKITKQLATWECQLNTVKAELSFAPKC